MPEITKKKLLIIADISNLYYTVGKYLNGKIDYKKFLDFIGQDYELYRMIGYGAELEGQADYFKNALRNLGFELKYKAPKEYHSAENGTQRKADWDVGMAMDIVKILDSVDVVALCTSDGDLAPVIEYIHSKGKVAVVYGCRISRDLRAIANQFHELTEDLLLCN